ncbi:MAG TPA: alkaline phosphatase family protein [Thermoanaerobaculia bacterium]|nr:alkaline phosphatase family protein [Thermoanaerobaculia bacterium]
MMRRPFLLLLALFACAPATPPPRVVPPPPPPQLIPSALAQRVVLVSFDGLGADALASQTDLSAFAALGPPTRVIPVNPTATSTAHVSILTGAQPDVHGVIANRFHAFGTPPEETTRGLEAPIDAETLVESARRQGKRVGAVPFPTVARGTSDFGFTWGMSETTPRTVHLTRDDFHREWVPPTWSSRPQRRVSYSPIMRARVEWSVPQKTRADVDVVAYDTTNDAAQNYDLFLIESSEREIEPDARGWFAVSAPGSDAALYGSWSKILQRDATLNDVAIYWGAISRTHAWPESYQAMLDAEVGFWPGAIDESRGISGEIFIEQTNRLAEFMTRAQVLSIQRMPFDLLLAYQPHVDVAGHTRFHEAAVMRAAFVADDRAVAAIRAALDPARDALVVTGDHGLAPIDTEVHMNALLAGSGFRAFAGNSVAHLYGSGNADAAIATLNATGLFEQVTKKAVNAHRSSGEIVAYAKPNVLLSPSADGPAIVKPSSAANHGALNVHRKLHTLLFATGAGAPRNPPAEIAQTKIARFVSQLLGIQPPAAAE